MATLKSFYEYATDDMITYCSCGDWKLTVDRFRLPDVVDKPHVVEGYVVEHLQEVHGMTPAQAYDAVLMMGGWQ